MSRRQRPLTADAALPGRLLGLPKAQAVAQLTRLGLVVRIVDWDEVEGGVMLTMELREDRVTVQVRDGVVVEAAVG